MGKAQGQIGQVALGVDGQDRNVVDERLFEQADTKTGFSAAGHSDDDGMGGEVLCIVEDDGRFGFVLIDMVGLPEVEGTQFFIIGHGDSFLFGTVSYGIWVFYFLHPA